MTTTQQVEIKVLEPHKAEGIKELCYKAINNPDKEFYFLGSPNLTLGERREMLLDARKQAQKAMADLEQESEEVLKGTVELGEDGKPVNNKAIILAKLDNIMNVVSIIDKNTIENTKDVCRKSQDVMAFQLGHAYVNFPITFEGEEVVVNCAFYEDISLNEKLLAEYTELNDEEKEIAFLKKHIDFGNISLTSKKDVEQLENFKPGEPGPDVVPTFANLDPIYQLVEVRDEVDK